MSTRQAVTEDFSRSIRANLAYWLAVTHDLAEPDFAALAPEWPNLMQAVEFGLGLPSAWPASGQLAWQLFEFVERQALWREWIPTLTRAAHHATAADRLTCQLLNQLGLCYRLDGRWLLALETLQSAHALAQQLNELELAARIETGMSEAYRCLAQYENAERIGQQSLIGLNDTDRSGKPMLALLNTLGQVAQATGQAALAEARLEQAVTLARAMGHSVPLARTLNNLANALQAHGDHTGAHARYAEAAGLLLPLDSLFDTAMVEISRGALYFAQGELVQAEAAFRRADPARLRRSGYWVYTALAYNNLGNALGAQQRYAEAEVYLREAVALWHQIGDQVELANSLGTLGEVLDALGQLAAAEMAFSEARQLLGRHPDDARARRLLASISDQQLKVAEKMNRSPVATVSGSGSG